MATAAEIEAMCDELSLEELISTYWHYRWGVEEALECRDSECRRHGGMAAVDRQRVADNYAQWSVKWLARIVKAAEEEL